MKKISKGFNNSVLLTLLFVACHVTGCKKIAVLPEITAGTQNAKSSVDTSNNKFFLLPSNTSPTIKTIARAIKKHDGEKKFLKNFIKRVGYPKWDQAKIININMVSSGRLSTEMGGQIVYLPFARDIDNYVNSVLVVKIQTNDTVFRMLHAINYDLFGYDTTNHNKWNARDIFNLFATFDYNVFGHTKFLIKDTKLFNRSASFSNTIATLIQLGDKNIKGNNSANRLNDFVQGCAIYQVCGTDENSNVARLSSLGGCYTIEACSNYDDSMLDGGGTVDYTGTGDGIGGGGTGSGSDGIMYYDDPCLTPTLRVSTATTTDCGSAGWEPIPVYNRFNIDVLVSSLEQNPAFLVNPCAYLDQWFGLAQFRVSQIANDRVEQVEQAYLNTTEMSMLQYIQHPCFLQDINDASSAVVNFDYFPIHISKLPIINGNQLNPQQLFEYFRLHWNDFVNTDIATFAPYQDHVINDVALWNSSNPLTSMLHLDMIDNGSVIISDFQSTPNQVKMIATTVRTPLDLEHPVSGHRSWGIEPDPSGGYLFYTTAVDRVTGVIPTVINTWFDRFPLFESGFESADKLWKSLQNKMIAFINSHGGQAEYYSSENYIKRPDWNDIDAYLKNQISLDELRRRIGC